MNHHEDDTAGLLRETLGGLLRMKYDAKTVEGGGFEFERENATVAVLFFDESNPENDFILDEPITESLIESGDLSVHLIVDVDGYIESSFFDIDSSVTVSDIMLWIVERTIDLTRMLSDPTFQQEHDDQMQRIKESPLRLNFHFQSRMSPNSFELQELLSFHNYRAN